MKVLTCVLLILIFLSCNKDNDNSNSEIPECIGIMILDNQLTFPIKTIQLQKVNGEFHYWLKTTSPYPDGEEFIVNNNCDTLCFFCGECILPECTNNYNGEWQIIWQK